MLPAKAITTLATGIACGKPATDREEHIAHSAKHAHHPRVGRSRAASPSPDARRSHNSARHRSPSAGHQAGIARGRSRTATRVSRDAHPHRSIKTFTIFFPQTGQTTEIHLDGDATIAALQACVADACREVFGSGATSARVFGLPKGPNTLPLAELKLKAPHRLVAVPFTGGDDAVAADSHVLSRAHIDAAHACILHDTDEDAVSLSDEDAFAHRVRLRVEKYAGFMQLAPLDATKKNLVLDIDFTLLDTDVFNTIHAAGPCSTTVHVDGAPVVLTPSRWTRPHLHAFLSSVHPFYNLIVWSATGNGHVRHKLAQAGVLSHAQYKICMLVDYGAMIRVRVRQHTSIREFNTKPLAVLWGLWPEHMNADNTLIVDDHRRSFISNASNGIHIRGYRASQQHRDVEFELLKHYLLAIKNVASMTRVRHDYWREVARGTVPLATVMHAKRAAADAATHGPADIDATARHTGMARTGSRDDDAVDSGCVGSRMHAEPASVVQTKLARSRTGSSSERGDTQKYAL